jgi:hypothetical protein
LTQLAFFLAQSSWRYPHRGTAEGREAGEGEWEAQAVFFLVLYRVCNFWFELCSQVETKAVEPAYKSQYKSHLNSLKKGKSYLLLV